MSQLSFTRPADTTSGSARAGEPRLAPFVLALAAALMVVGLVMAFSTSGSLDRPFWPSQPINSIALRQGLFATMAAVAMWLSSLIRYQILRWRTVAGTNLPRPWWMQPSVALLGLAVLCLTIVLIPGLTAERNGARRWLQFGTSAFGLGFQPSELAKVCLVLFLSAWLPALGHRVRRFWTGIVLPGLVVGAVACLIGVEDLGTAALVALVGGILILAAGARWWHAVLLALPGLAGFAAMILTRDYRLNRLTSFWNIWDDPLRTDFHAIQSLIAIASGGWRGAGIGAGMQKLGYLPEARHDFVFAVICEEMGLIGGLAVIGLFTCLCLAGWRIVSRTRDPQGKLLALGLTALIGFQACMNVAVVTVMVPTKGISLPLVSAGGSGLILYGIAIGLLAAVDRSGHTRDLERS
jgi:cell division protein FtsW